MVSPEKSGDIVVDFFKDPESVLTDIAIAEFRELISSDVAKSMVCGITSQYTCQEEVQNILDGKLTHKSDITYDAAIEIGRIGCDLLQASAPNITSSQRVPDENWQKWLDKANNFIEFSLDNFPIEATIVVAKTMITSYKLPLNFVYMPISERFNEVVKPIMKQV